MTKFLSFRPMLCGTMISLLLGLPSRAAGEPAGKPPTKPPTCESKPFTGQLPERSGSPRIDSPVIKLRVPVGGCVTFTPNIKAECPPGVDCSLVAFELQIPAAYEVSSSTPVGTAFLPAEVKAYSSKINVEGPDFKAVWFEQGTFPVSADAILQDGSRHAFDYEVEVVAPEVPRYEITLLDPPIPIVELVESKPTLAFEVTYSFDVDPPGDTEWTCGFVQLFRAQVIQTGTGGDLACKVTTQVQPWTLDTAFSAIRAETVRGAPAVVLVQETFRIALATKTDNIEWNRYSPDLTAVTLPACAWRKNGMVIEDGTRLAVPGFISPFRTRGFPPEQDSRWFFDGNLAVTSGIFGKPIGKITSFAAIKEQKPGIPVNLQARTLSTSTLALSQLDVARDCKKK